MSHSHHCVGILAHSAFLNCFKEAKVEEFLSVNDPFKVRPKHLNLILVEILTRSVLFFFFFLLFCVCFLTFVGGLAALTFRSLCYYITHMNFSKSSGPEAAKHYTTTTMFDLFDVL